MTLTPMRGESVSGVGLPAGDELAGEMLRCVQVQFVTHDVRSFVFEPSGFHLAEHVPGQYLVITVVIDGEHLERCYTISSPPSRPSRLSITVKAEPGGRVSNWLHDNMVPGLQVHARGPYGRFSPEHHPSDKLLLLSGGSGATPMMSIARTCFDLGRPVDIAYVHSARTPADILFRQELSMMASSTHINPTMRVTHFCERDSADELWSGPRGRVHSGALADLVPDVRSREVFACGPAPYLEAVREIVSILGVPESQYHEESFVVSAPEGPTDLPPPDSSALTYEVSFARSQRTIQCGQDETLLLAAARAGVPIPSSCQEGVCGTCKLTCLSGEVDMSHQGGIRPKEIAAGKILACCSRPRSNVVLKA